MAPPELARPAGSMTSARRPRSTSRSESVRLPLNQLISPHRNVLEALRAKQPERVHQMLQQLEELVSSAHTHLRSGGIIGLTGIA
jgi:DNA-binding GntR family transcriptional regulator